MNGINEMVDKIAEDAQREADLILAEAGAQAAAIAKRYADLAKKEGEHVLEAGRQRAKGIRRHIVSLADQDAKLKILTTKQEMISRVFDLALERLMELPREEYIDLLARLAAASSSGSEEIVLSPRDRSAFGDQVVEKANGLLRESRKNSNLTLSAKTGDFDGGLMLRAGKVDTNCTLQAILRELKEEMAAQVGVALFPH